MHLFTLKDIYLGEPDGKKEAAYKANFDDFFLNYNNIYEQAMDEKTYLIVGSKGSGKTLLAELIKKKENLEMNHFCDIISYKKLKYQELIHFNNGDVAPNQFTSIWEWSILIEMAKFIIKNSDPRLEKSNEYNQLKIFLENNFFELDISTDAVMKITREQGIRGQVLLHGIGGSAENKETAEEEHGNYIQYITALKRCVLHLIECSWNKYTIIIDELDDRFRAESICTDSIISLVKIVDELNLDMYKRGSQSKIIVLLRTDILGIINDADLNKIREGNSLTLNWGTRNDESSPLFDLIFQKAKASVPLIQSLDRRAMFNLLLTKETHDNRLSLKWLLSRTQLRPRDLINYLKIIQDGNPRADTFEYDEFNRLEHSYSICFLHELQDELSGHFDPVIVNLFLKLLKKLGKSEFSYGDVETVFQENKRFQVIGDLEGFLENMFDFNIIGNRSPQTGHFDWHYRDDLAYFKKEEIIVVHAGIRKALGL